MPIKAMQESSERGPYDELYTPEEAISYIIPYLKGKKIWESAPGKLNIVNILKKNGIKTIWKDRDYFEWEPPDYDIQVTNPPFSIKAKWLKRANELGKPYAILLHVTTLGSRSCQSQLEESDILFLPRRIDFTGKKAPWFAVAWFTKDLLPERIMFINE